MSKSIKYRKFLLSLGLLFCANGCGQLLPISETLLKNPALLETFSSVSNRTHHPVSIIFLNRLSNNQLVPLVPSLIQTITFDRLFHRQSKDYDLEKGVHENFPFIESGEHLIEIQFPDQAEEVLVPVVIPEEDSETTILIVVSFEKNTNQIASIIMGYDQNQDNQVDNNRSQYKSQDGQTYIIQYPDGTIESWQSKFLSGDGEKPVPETGQPLPPGALPQTGNRPEEKNQPKETTKPPVIKKVEIPKRVPPPSPPDTPKVPTPPH